MIQTPIACTKNYNLTLPHTRYVLLFNVDQSNICLLTRLTTRVHCLARGPISALHSREKGWGFRSWRSALHSASSELCGSNEITPRSGPNVLEQAGDCKSKIKQARWSGHRALLVNAIILLSVRN